jgi:alanyl-tRNA synthetase
MLFGEKYGEQVRMITFDPSFSIELCGDAMYLQPDESDFSKSPVNPPVAAGVRRIEAITAKAAEDYVHDQWQLLSSIRNELKNPMDVVKAIRDLQTEIKTLKQQLEEVEIQKATGTQKSLLQKVEVINGVKLVAAEVEINDPKLLKTLIYQVDRS